jgi:CheY-like chemotaxis protein
MTAADRKLARRVLVVDDDNSVLEMVTATLVHKGFAVVAAANVPEALVRANRGRELRRAYH